MPTLFADDRSWSEFMLRNWGKVQPKVIETPAKASSPDAEKKPDDLSKVTT